MAGVAVTLALAGCGGGGIKTFDNPHGTLTVDTKSSFAVELEVNQSVGYDWQLIPTIEFESAPVTLAKAKVDYPDEKRAGESGTKRFEFKTTDRGRATIIFQHSFRGLPRDRRVLTVDVRPSGP